METKNRIISGEAAGTSRKGKPLPLIGTITGYLPMVKGRPAPELLTGERRRIYEAERTTVRGDFSGGRAFYAQVRKDGAEFLSAADVTMLKAVGSGDLELFDEIWADVAAYPARYGTEAARQAAEIYRTWVTRYLRAEVDLPRIKVDRKRLTQVLFNLVSNAVKFTENGGVTVRIGFTMGGPRSVAAAVGKEPVLPTGSRVPRDRAVPTGMLTLSVIDTGVGIAAADIPKVMQPFVRIENKTQTGGTGLGLPISNLLVKQMGGAISLTSKPGKGSTFSVTLPNVEYEPLRVEELKSSSGGPRSVAAADGTEPVPPTVPLQLRLLLVDDAPMNLTLLTAYCRKIGVQDVVTANSGAEALGKLQEQSFDVVFTDVWMPGMSGEQLVAKIRENLDWADLPVYAITADVEMKKRARGTPFTGVIYKPVRLETLQALLVQIASGQNRSRTKGKKK